MRGRSLVVILGAGFFVLIAQLVIWLTPARNLIVDTADTRAALDQSDPASVNKAENAVRSPTIREVEISGDVSELNIQGTPTVAEKTVATQSPSASMADAERDVGQASAGEASTAADEVTALAKEPEANDSSSQPVDEAMDQPVPQLSAESNVGEAGVAPIGDDEATARAPATTEPQAEDSPNQPVDDASIAAKETTAPAATVPEPQAEVDASKSTAEAAAGAPEKLHLVDILRSKLTDPVLRKGAHPDDLTALEAFYAEYDGSARWVTSTGLTAEAQAIVSEIAKADDWGLDAKAFQVPPPDFKPTTAEDQAAVEAAIDFAILKYARAAQGGLADPSAENKVFAQEPSMREPATVVTEIFAAPEPDAYLRDFHPKHAQFERLRQALVKTQTEGNIARLKANMERWRWMPQSLGAHYVWLNIPEFMLYVVKDGQAIHSEKVVVGSSSNPTPVLSADMTSIVFNPERVVPLSIIRKDVLPKLQKSEGFFGRGGPSVLEQYQLTVKREGKPVDPNKIDWDNVNLSKFTFVQAPSPTNVLGKVQFLYPNDRGVYMHDTIFRGQLSDPVRAKGQREPRVANPKKLATLLLAEGNGWSKAKVDQAAKGNNIEVKLDHPIPVHMTYFTAIVDDEGQMTTFDDIYNLDALDTPSDASGDEASKSGAIPLPSRNPSSDENRSAQAN